MTKFSMEINSENAAFSDMPEIEVARIISKIAVMILAGQDGGPCYDINGNRVGVWAYDPSESDESSELRS